MYLKSIEVQGFKSFANKIVFDFHNGITGIVGPNGSGKSNVADAVRWVLGEQKVRALRSSSMQDVIFAGTQNRKPVSFAYVAITLDNSDHKLPLDYNEVTVARRVYRSGESEYLLNGVQCRLKDVNELFYDTGIGKEGYSIIGQGQIDQILSGKPEERRELFDEAAGIVKFKRRKATAVKKLEDEQANLVRIDDILAELERQVEPLERQSEQARIYLKKKEELKTLDVNLFLLEMERIRQEQGTVESHIAIAKGQQSETGEEYERIRLSYEELATALETADARHAELTARLSEAGVSREKLEGQINVLKEQIRAAQVNEANDQSRMEELKSDIAARHASGEEYTEQIRVLDQKLQELSGQKEALNAQLEAARAEAKEWEQTIEAGKTGLLKLINDRSTMKAELQRCDTMLEQTQLQRARLNQRLLTEKSTGGDVEELVKEQEEQLFELNGRIQELERQREEQNAQRSKWRDSFEALRESLDGIREQYHRDASRLESLRNIAERYDGYGSSIRRVMERKADTPGIHGVVADIIKVEKKYETAIETALGGSIQNIVTEDEATAKEMIAYLKQNRYGRATFLPLTSVSGSENTAVRRALGEPGALGVASELVQTQERYRRVAGYLLGRVLVADTIDHAIAIEKKFHYSLRIVTLEGESLQPGGSMTGGAFRNSSNLLGRNREIELLEKSIRERREEAREVRSRMEDVRTANALLKDDLEELNASLQELYLEQNSRTLELSHVREERDAKETAYRQIEKELSELSGKDRELLAQKEELAAAMTASEQQEEELTGVNRSLSERLDYRHEELQSMQEQLNALTLSEAQINQRISFQQENILRLAEEIKRIQADQEALYAASKNSVRAIDEKEQEIERLRQTITDTGALQSEMSEALETCAREKEEMTGRQKGFFERRETLASQMSELDRELLRLNNQKERLESSTEALTGYMWEEYELTLHAAEPLRSPDCENAAELKKQIAETKDAIRSLGNVNVNAIEEYREVSERYNFLNAQHEDLLEAEKTLQGIIAELDEGMRHQFTERFADIQREFDKAFKELFGGGRGTLELTEDEDILECGVRIIAQPPGKKLQNMMQLSGGEKALTAIALLFAIQNLKPSPFCLLDEIEAALDDSNVDRFANYLHKLTRNTQFIIITHRRGTMSAADRLYGITMQEKGVSALVSVNLIERELDE